MPTLSPGWEVQSLIKIKNEMVSLATLSKSQRCVASHPPLPTEIYLHQTSWGPGEVCVAGFAVSPIKIAQEEKPVLSICPHEGPGRRQTLGRPCSGSCELSRKQRGLYLPGSIQSKQAHLVLLHLADSTLFTRPSTSKTIMTSSRLRG